MQKRIIDRYPGETPTEVIKVDLGADGFNSHVEVDPNTNKISITPPAGLDSDQLKEWEAKTKDVAHLSGLVRKKLMETNQMTNQASQELAAQRMEIEKEKQTLQEKQRQLDLALQNLGKNNSSNTVEVKPLHEFLGIKPEDLPTYISEKPTEYMQKFEEWSDKKLEAKLNDRMKANQATSQAEAIKQQAITDGIDYADFINNYCNPMGAQPNLFAYQTYKAIKQGTTPGGKSAQQMVYDLDKFSVEVMPVGSHSFSFDKVTEDDLRNMTDAELKAYDQYLKSKR